MANDLNFKVILDDAEFNEKIENDVKLAKDLNTSLSSLLEVKAKVGKTKISSDAIKIERFKKATADAAAAQERLKAATTNTATAQERQKTATLNTATAQERLTQAQMRTQQIVNRNTAQIERQNRAYKQQSRILNELKGYALGYLSIHGASQLVSSLVKVTGEFELQKTTLAAMIGDLNSAEQIITRIQGLAVESPFQFKELTTYAKQLSAFSVPAQELYDTTKMLADISAGLGVGMDRIVLAYGQVRSAAFLRGQEVRQFTEAGIPILDELAKQFSELEGRAVSAGEVFDKISKRLVPFEMVAKVFKDMTSEGGKFYNMQEVQAETLKGKISNLKDAYEMMLNEIGKGQSENLKGAVDWARKLMTNYEETGRVLMELITAYGVYKAAVIALTLATNTFTLANHKLLTQLVKAASWASKNPYVILAAGITAAGFAIYKNITALEGYEKVHKTFLDTEKKYGAELAAEQAKLDSLYSTLKFAKEGTEEYNKAKKELYTKYSGYISELDNEGVAINDLAILYDNLKIKIEEASQARFRLIAQQDIDETFATEVQKIYNRFDKLKEGINERLEFEGRPVLDADNTAAFMQYITGGLSITDIANDPRLKQLSSVLNGLRVSTKEYADKLRDEMAAIKKTYAEDSAAIAQLYGEVTEEIEDKNPFKIPLEDETSEEQKAIEAQIKSIQKLKDAYEKLMPYLDEMQMKSTLKDLFPSIGVGIIDSLDFNAELEKLADRLAEFDKDAAQRLRDTVSKDIAGSIAESFKAVEQYKKMLDSWMGEDFDIMGEGTAFDISKILTSLNTEYSKIDQRRKNALDLLNKAQIGDEIALAKVREIYGEEVWEKYLAKGEQVINELATKEAAAARATANEKIRDLADKDLKERMEKANINLTDFDDKTIAQVDEAYTRLFVLRNQLHNELEMLQANGVMEEEEANVQRLEEELKNLDVVIEDTGVELEKKVYDRAKSCMQAISGLGSSISKLGSAMGNTGISRFGEELSRTADFASNLMDAFKAKDTIALIANVATYVIETVANVASYAYERQQALNDAAREYSEIMNQTRRDSYSGIYGTDEMGLAIENQRILAEEQKKYQETLAKAEKVKWQRFSGSNYRTQSVIDELENAAITEGWELYRKSGELNIEALEAYFEVYKSRFSKKQRDLISELIENGKALDDAAAQQAEYLTSLFGNVADNISSSMIDAFLESGDAAIDMRNMVSDIAKEMVADLIKTMYIMPILDRYRDKFAQIDSDTTLTPSDKAEAQLSLLETALGEISSQSGVISDTIERFEDYLGEGTEAGTEIGQGIKGITEDQANLLASYLNAIRADVSFSKTLWIKMDANLQKIADMLTSSPTLMEYQAQIAANTHDTAMASQAILSELRSVITTDSGDTAIRVNS